MAPTPAATTAPLSSLPSTAGKIHRETVELIAAFLAAPGSGRTALARRLAAIDHPHRQRGLPPPGAEPSVRAVLRQARRAASPAAGYIWLTLGTPVLVQLIVIYTGLPQLGLRLNVIESAIIGLGVNEGAYLAEIFRAGIMAVPAGQSEAARAIGLSRMQAMRLVILPQALRIALPPLGNAFNVLMKTSSLASVISTDELLRRTEMLIQVQFKVLEIFIVAAMYYLAMTTVWGLVQAQLERHLARGTSEHARDGGQTASPLLALPTQDAA